MHKIYELKETLCEELESYGGKGKLSTGELDIVDKLAHTVKNLDKIIDRCDEDEYSGYDYGYDERRNYASAKKMPRSRYSRSNDMMISELHELMKEAPDEKTKQEFRNFISKIEKM